MKKAWKRNEQGVSPVIATILMVAITVVLAAVLYVMVIGMTPPVIEGGTPLGLLQQGKNTTSVSILVADANTDAKVHGTEISLSHDNVPTQITGAAIYDSSALKAAEYAPGSGWTYLGNYTADNLNFHEGYILVVSSASISAGDKIVITSAEGNFGPTTFNVS